MFIKLIVVDDNMIQAEGLTKLFHASDKIDFKGNISSPELCLERLAENQEIDIILLDVNFPDSKLSGLDLVDRIRSQQPFQNEKGQVVGPRIIFFSVETAGFVDEERGVFGLIPKNADFSTIVSMIEMVCKYGATFPLENKSNAQPKFWGKLSKKEKQIFELILLGKPTKEIAKTLNPGLSTVDKRRKTILNKIRKSGLKVNQIHEQRIQKLIAKHEDYLKIWKECPKSEKNIIQHLIHTKSPSSITTHFLQKMLDVLASLSLDFKEINDADEVRITTRYNEILDFWEAFTKKEKDFIRLLINARSISTFNTKNLKNLVKNINRLDPEQGRLTHPALKKLLTALEGDLKFWKELSKKEQEFMLLFVKGKSNEETAKEIIPSQLTVITHRKNILKKIKASGLQVDKIDDPRLVKLVLDYGLCKVGSL